MQRDATNQTQKELLAGTVSISGSLDQQKSRKSYHIMGIIGIFIILAFFISMNLGMIRLSPWDIMKTLIGMGTERQSLILYDFRLPRIVIAMLIGAGLAVSGAILQAVSRNPLADPGILGINAGAGLAVASFLMFYPRSGGDSVFILPLFALLGGGMAAVLIYLLAWKRGTVSPIRLILVGIGVAMLFNALLLFIQIKMDPNTFMYATVWLAGSIWGTDWKFVLALLPWPLIFLPFALYKAPVLNVLHLGEQVAVGLGTAVEKQRLLLLVTAVALASSSVAVGGGIAFVGLVAPHLARRLIGPQHQHLIPASALVGALLMLAADMLAKQLLAPNEIPVGIVVSAIGAPYFLYLMAKTRT